MTFSDRIRDSLRAEIGPCPCCHGPRSTIAEMAANLDQPPSSVGRFLAGGKPSVALLDVADAWLDEKRASGDVTGTVRDAGGGEVQVVVDRDTAEYPEVGARVSLEPRL